MKLRNYLTNLLLLGESIAIAHLLLVVAINGSATIYHYPWPWVVWQEIVMVVAIIVFAVYNILGYGNRDLNQRSTEK